MENTEFYTASKKLVDTVDYTSGSVVTKSIYYKKTGSVSISSFDTGEIFSGKATPFENLIQIIDGVAEVIIDGESSMLKVGESIIIPAHSTNALKANQRFKMMSTIIKSGYEDIEV